MCIHTYIIFIMYVCMCVYEHVQVPKESRRESRTGAEVTGSCEPPNVGAKN